MIEAYSTSTGIEVVCRGAPGAVKILPGVRIVRAAPELVPDGGQVRTPPADQEEGLFSRLSHGAGLYHDE